MVSAHCGTSCPRKSFKCRLQLVNERPNWIKILVDILKHIKGILRKFAMLLEPSLLKFQPTEHPGEVGTRVDKLYTGCARGDHKCAWRSENMASWKCGVYVVVGTILIAIIILLNFDLLPKRRLSEELELTTKSSFKGSTTSKGIPNTLKARPTERTTSNLHSAVTKVRLLKFNGKCT